MTAPTLEERIASTVTDAVAGALAPYLRRLGEPERATYSIPQAAIVLGTSANTVRRLVDEGHLPLVPHMGERRLIPRHALHAFIDGGTS